MKKIFLFICTLSMSFLNAQDITDALRHSQQNVLGTARFRGMSGAFGALGGDLSALQINPAGSAVFVNPNASLTLSTGTINNDATYFNEFNSNRGTNLNLNQIGVVFIYDDFDPESNGINKFSLGLAYDQTADNADEFLAFGRSSNSIDSFFLTEAQGIPLDIITLRSDENIDDLYSFLGENEGFSAQQAFLGHESFLIEANDLNDPDNTSYFSNIAPGVFDQEYYAESRGLNGKFTLNGGAQINKNYYVGFNLNSHFISYDRITRIVENNNNTGSIVNEVLFTNRLSTSGAGFSAQIGGIAKVSDMIRLGVSYETPTWYYIEEETIQRIETFGDTNGRIQVDPRVTNIFPEYRLRTPGNVTGSLAFVFGQQGLISLDYSYKDYSSINLRSDLGVNFSNTNTDINNSLQAASTVRLGTEWRNDNWSFRGGLSYEESPYKNSRFLGDKSGYSIGVGYNFGKVRLDVAYDNVEQQREEDLFAGSGFTNFAGVDSVRDNLTFTLSINF